MAIQIKPTPKLQGEDADRFFKQIEKNERASSNSSKVVSSYANFKSIVSSNKDVARLFCGN